MDCTFMEKVNLPALLTDLEGELLPKLEFWCLKSYFKLSLYSLWKLPRCLSLGDVFGDRFCLMDEDT